MQLKTAHMLYSRWLKWEQCQCGRTALCTRDREALQATTPTGPSPYLWHSGVQPSSHERGITVKKKKKKLIGERRRSSNHLSHDNNGSSPIRQKKSKQCSPGRGGARKVQRWVILRIKSVWVQYSLSLKATHWYDEENKTQTPHHDEELRGQSWTWNIVNDRILMWTNPWIDTIWAAFIST